MSGREAGRKWGRCGRCGRGMRGVERAHVGEARTVGLLGRRARADVVLPLQFHRREEGTSLTGAPHPSATRGGVGARGAQLAEPSAGLAAARAVVRALGLEQAGGGRAGNSLSAEKEKKMVLKLIIPIICFQLLKLLPLF